MLSSWGPNFERPTRVAEKRIWPSAAVASQLRGSSSVRCTFQLLPALFTLIGENAIIFLGAEF